MTNRDQYQHMIMLTMRAALEDAKNHIDENNHLAPPSPHLKAQMETAIAAHKGYEDMPLKVAETKQCR